MNQRQLHIFTMLEDALATATHNPPPSPPSDFTVILDELTEVLTQAKGAAVAQASDRGTSSTTLRSARMALFTDHLIPIRDIAVGRLTTVPNVRQLFRLPVRTAHRTTLLKEATIIAHNAEPYKDIFIASGRSVDFIDQLYAAIEAVTQTGETRVNSRHDQQQATQSLKMTLKQGQQLVRGLNGIMQSAFAKDPAVLAVWNSARRLRRVTANAEPSVSTQSTDDSSRIAPSTSSSVSPDISPTALLSVTSPLPRIPQAA